jgi:hypothetical protein
VPWLALLDFVIWLSGAARRRARLLVDFVEARRFGVHGRTAGIDVTQLFNQMLILNP